MLDKIIKYSLENRLIIILLTVLLVMTGSYVTTRTEIDVFPDLTAPTVVIMTEAHGMAPEEVERLVSFPIETSVNGATDIRRVRSSSAMGFSMVWAEFDWGTDIYNARQTITERLIQVREQLPTGVGEPFIAPQSSIMGEIMAFALTADTTSPMELRTLVEWNIRPRLLSVGGVAQITTTGGDFKEYQILVDPYKLKHFNISFSKVIEISKDLNENVPGKFFNQYGTEYIIRGISRTKSIEDIGNSVVDIVNGMPVRLSDVAEIKIGPAMKIGDGSYGGQKAAIVTITKQPHVNTIELTENIKEALVDIQKNLSPDIKIHTDIFEQARFIDISINNVLKAIIEGAIFVVVILILFLMNMRTSIISITAIPLSILFTIIAMKLMGITINTMTLGGIAIAIGALVDDAIIDVENVYKRLRQNAALPKAERKASIKVVFDASSEIRTSIMNATLIIIVAFVPLFFLGGMEGRMLKPLGISFILALFASLLVAVTLTPVMCSYLLTNEKSLLRHQDGSWVERNLIRIYSKSLKQIMNYKALVIGLALTLLGGSIGLMFTFGQDFLPPFNEGSLTINTATIPGISLEESNKLGADAERLLLEIPEIQATARRTGRAELAEHAFGVNVSEIDCPFELQDRSRSEFIAEVRQKLSTLPGVIFEVGQPISHRIDAMLSGSKANIAIKLFGDDLGIMYKLANQVRDEIAIVEGIGDLSVEQQIDIPQLKIIPKRDMLAKYGITIQQFNQFIDYGFGGEEVCEVFEGERVFPLILRFNDRSRENMEAISNTLIDTYDGGTIPLHYIADIKSSSGPNTINRENVKRKLVVSINVADRDVGSVVNDIQHIIDANIILPENYHIEYGGQFESAAKATKALTIASIISLIVIFLILFQEFKNTKTAALILVNLPLGLIGGIIAIYFSSGVISIPAIIGFITLFGIATRNGILLVSRYDALKKQGITLYERIVKGSTDRLNPILMTALTAALALIPLAIAGDKPGNEIQSPMAIVILGGLLSSTLLNIFIIPVIYYLLNRKELNHENA
ncbi:MAG: efflux RND transporter permease subunit [Bacteroidales bacterium]|nr:efflux RND transporter permease subunit [Bacteroidales bacterium]